MVADRQISVLETQSKTSGFVETAQQATKLDAALDGATESSKRLTQAQISSEGSFNRVRLKYDEAAKSAAILERELATIARAEAQGHGTVESRADAAAGALARHEAALRKIASAANDNAGAIANQARALDDVRAKFNPFFAAQQRYVALQAEISQGFKTGALNAHEHARALAEATTGYQRLATAAIAATHGLTDANKAQQVAASQKFVNKFAGAPVGPDVKADFAAYVKRQDDIEAFGQELDNLRAKYSPVFAAQRQYEAELKEINLLLQAGVLSEKEHAAAVAKAADAYQRAAGGARSAAAPIAQVSKNFGLASYQLQNLGFQLNDLVVQIGSGGGIFRPLLQQGAQIQQILSMSEGGVGGVLSRVATSMKAIGPAAIIGWGAAATAIGGVVIGTGLAVKAMVDYREELAATQRLVTSGKGRLSGVTSQDIDAAGEAAAKAGNIATTDARAAAREFAATGKIGREVMTDLTHLSEPLARVLGLTLPEANKKLAAAFADPAKGVETLADELGILNAAQINHIQTLQRTEGRYAAQKQLLSDVRKEMAGFGQEMTTLSYIANKFSADVRSDFDAMRKAIGEQFVPPSLEQQLDALERRIKGIQEGAGRFTAPTPQGEAPRAQDDLKNLTAEREQILRQMAQNAAKAAQDAFNEISKAGREAAMSLDPIGAAFIDLQTKAKALKDALAVPAPTGDLILLREALERVTNAMGGATTAAEAREVAFQRMVEQGNLAVAAINAQAQAITAQSQAEIASIAGKQALNAAEAAGASNREKILAQRQAEALVIAQQNAAQEQAIRAGNQQIAQGRLELQTIMATTVAQRAQLAAEQSMLSTEGSLLTMTQRLTLAEQARQKVIQASVAALREMISAQQDDIRLKQAEIASLGQSDRIREPMLAKMRAENELRRMGIDLLSQQAREYIKNAGALASVNVKMQEAEEIARKSAEALKAMGNSFDWVKGAGPAFDAFGKAIQRVNTNLATTAQSAKVLHSIIPAENTMAELFPVGKIGFYLPGIATKESSEATLKQLTWVLQKHQGLSAEEADRAARLQLQSGRGRYDTKLSDFIEMPKDDIEELGDAAKTAADKLGDISSLGQPIESKIDTLRGMQETALSRPYRPDPYAEKNPEFFYSGERIFKEAQDRIYDGLQAQIVKLESLQASLGTLVTQNQQLPQTLVDALIAAGFADIAEKIIAAFAVREAPSATPNPTAVQSSLMQPPRTDLRSYGRRDWAVG